MIDPDLVESKLIEWQVQVGDEASKGDIVADVGTQKVLFEIEACEG